MTSEKGCRKEKNQNIQVFVRLRPLNQRERDIKSLGVVEVVNGREVVVRQSHQSLHTKRFTFDRAFPPSSKQVEIYQEVVSPLIEEVLAGYNCTVFAYGQTGTGKTHTMVGEAAPDETTWQSDPLAGIIPRALSQLFDELRISNTEYTVRVSYLELYNEELFDLLSTSEDNSKLRIYEDVTRKGANIVNGLEEITVYNKNEVFRIMAQGQERKRVASTLMNAQSSDHPQKEKLTPRSHTVFTIVVHMKENSPEGEELVKIGKLNLVDLAGSENISKAGSDNPAKRERARECVNINQSLLTLGRVITALVERHPHIPYRESKLTRILQESLGGRTKTSIIATISPGHKDLEETMSTLEYANRAKNIQNKPEINQKMTKKAILKEYAEEIDRLKRDLYATREKNGVYLANETFSEMTMKQEEQRKEIQELLLKKRAMEDERERMEAVFRDLNCSLEDHKQRLSTTVHKLCTVENVLANTTNVLKTTKLQYEEQKHLVSKRAETENTLSSQAQQLLAVADAASSDASKLLDTVHKRKSVESTNLEITRTYREISAQHRNNLTNGTDNFVGSLTQALGDIQAALDSYTAESTEMQTQSKQKLDELVKRGLDTMNRITMLRKNMQNEMESTAQSHCSQFHQIINAKAENVQNILERLALCVVTCLQRAGQVDLSSDMTNFLNEWQQTVARSLSALRSAGGEAERCADGAAQRARVGAGRRQRARSAAAALLAADLEGSLASIIEEKNHTEKYLADLVSSIENEKLQHENRLLKWAEDERRLLEERIERHIAAEKKYLEDNMKEKLKLVDSQRILLEKRTAMHVEEFNKMLTTNKELMDQMAEDLVEHENELELCLNDLKNFVREFENDTTNIESSINSLRDGAVSVVEKVKTDLVEELQQSQTYIQNETTTLKEQNQEMVNSLTRDINGLVESLIQNSHRTLDSIVGEVNTNSTKTIEELSSLSSASSNISSASHCHQNSQTLALGTLQRNVEQFHCGVRTELGRLEELEGRCLNQEYAVYCPSGNTPVRAEYRFPRTLAATSPHERILAKFRAMRQDSNDDDCILLETDGETRSDSDSSTEESSVQSPQAQQHQMSIVKCTSETELYLRRRQQEQGKENTNKSVAFKKPSKLPAPASHKKPLIERNSTT